MKALKITTDEARPVKPVRNRKVQAPKPKPGDRMKAWAYSGVGLTLTASAGLNGMAFAEHAPSAAAGWALGVAIPVMLLIGAQVATRLYTAGRKRLSYCGYGACLSMLALSVQHCACSIARLTGEHIALAAMMAVAIDGIMVVCELATIRTK